MTMTLSQCVDACRNEFPFQPHAVDCGLALASLLDTADFLADAALKYSISHTTVSVCSPCASRVPDRWINLFATGHEIHLTLLQRTASKPRTIRHVTHSRPVDATQDLEIFVNLLDSTN